jgi:hypothetical protein
VEKQQQQQQQQQQLREAKITVVEQKAGVSGPKLGLLSLVRPRTILLRTLNMGYQWFSATMGFYGITFSLTTLSDKVNAALSLMRTNIFRK